MLEYIAQDQSLEEITDLVNQLEIEYQNVIKTLKKLNVIPD
jgi:archaellum component FlaD/FlaE